MKSIQITVPLSPHRLDINRDGNVRIHYRTVVRDTQTFSVSSQRAHAAKTVKSLQVKDNRTKSALPKVIFPSPPLRSNGVQNLSLPERWLVQHVGEIVQIVSDNIPISGRLLSLHSPSPADCKTGHHQPHATALIEGDGKISSVLLTDDISVSTASGSRSAALSIEGLSDHISGEFPIVITACGQGEGILELSFETIAVVTPPFEFRYIPYTTKDIALGEIDENAKVECTAMITNPLPFALHDVELRLSASRSHGKTRTTLSHYENGDLSKEDDKVSDPGTSYFRFGSDDVLDLNDGIASVPMFYENNDPFYHKLPDFELDVPGKVSLPVGGSTCIQLFRAKCTVKISHYLKSSKSDSTADPTIFVKHESYRTFESGIWYVPFPVCNVYVENALLIPGEIWHVGGVRAMNHMVSSRMSLTKRTGMESLHEIIGNEMHTRQSWTQLKKIDLHNKAQREVEVIVGATIETREGICAQKMAWECKGSGDMRSVECEEYPHRQFGYYHIRLNANEQTCLFIEDKIFNIKTWSLCSYGDGDINIRGLDNQGPERDVAEKLDSLNIVRGKMRKLERSRAMHMRKRHMALRTIENKNEVKLGTVGEERAVVEIIQEYITTCSKLNKMVRMLDDEIEKVEMEMKKAGTEMDEMISNLRKMVSPESC